MGKGSKGIDVLGREKFCKHCWACYQGEKCIAAEDNRIKGRLCEKAKARMNGTSPKEEREEAVKSAKSTAVAVKKYLSYIPKRIAFLKIFNAGVPSNEYKYYRALQEAIKEWGKKHVVFYGCLYGKIGIEAAKAMFGVSEATFYRLMHRQRSLLIDFIEEQEILLSEKYPFIPMSDIFMED